ncbi:mucin-22-like [Haliotis asinina]|uniref:mucin-22-like n=1 Tax=Haliotis asinina TaxID=109174 RepID=UPI003531DC38
MQRVIILLLGLFPFMITGQQTAQECEQYVNVCTVQFSVEQDAQLTSGFNATAICSIVDDFMVCVNTALAPCDVVTKNTLRSAIDQLIGIYSDFPYNCVLDFAQDFEYGNCSQQVTQCAFFKYAAEDLRNNATEACKEFDGFVACMQENTTACKGAEQTEILQSIQNTTTTFSQCPFACNRPDLVCVTEPATTTSKPAVFDVSILATPVLSSVVLSDMDLSEYYEYTITPSEVFYNPSDGLSMYTADLSEFYNLDPSDAILESQFPSESDPAVVATETMTNSMTSSQLSTDQSSTSSQTTLTTRTTSPATSNSPEGTTTTPSPSTSSTTAKPTTAKTNNSDKTSSATTTSSTTTTVKPTTSKTTEQQKTSTTEGTVAKTTTDFPPPNYDNAAVVQQMSAITVLTSLVLAMMS